MDLTTRILHHKILLLTIGLFLMTANAMAQNQQNSEEEGKQKEIEVVEEDESVNAPESFEIDTIIEESLDQKLDKILEILTGGIVDLPGYIESIKDSCNESIAQVKEEHDEEIEKLKERLKSKSEKLTERQTKLNAKKNELENYKKSSEKDFQTIIPNVFSASTTLGLEGVKIYKDLAIKYAPEFKDPIQTFISSFQEVIDIKSEFGSFSNFEKYKSDVTYLEIKVEQYPGLSLELDKIQQLVDGYCSKENELIVLLAFANTQQRLEGYEEKLREGKSKFREYPKLEKAVVDALEDRNYKYIPSCEANTSE